MPWACYIDQGFGHLERGGANIARWRLLFVVYTRRRGLIRVVTARDAHPDDRRWYRR